MVTVSEQYTLECEIIRLKEYLDSALDNIQTYKKKIKRLENDQKSTS